MEGNRDRGAWRALEGVWRGVQSLDWVSALANLKAHGMQAGAVCLPDNSDISRPCHMRCTS